MPRRRKNLFAPAMLAFEAQQVIALRMMKLAWGGPAAYAEANRMVSEKMTASAEAATLAAMAVARGNPAAAPGDVVKMLRRKVRANRRRLTT